MKIRFHFWPWGLITVFALFFCGTVTLVVITSLQNEDLVSNNYYEQELRYQGRVDSIGRTRQLAVQATARYDAATRRIIVTLPPEHAGKNATGSIELYRPNDASLDQSLALSVDQHGVQALDASALKPGLWKVRVDWRVDGCDYYVDQKVTNAPAAEFPQHTTVGPSPAPAVTLPRVAAGVRVARS
jgi:hypothetical protein